MKLSEVFEEFEDELDVFGIQARVDTDGPPRTFARIGYQINICMVKSKTPSAVYV